jgi:pre-mRNA-splicing factor ISY1
MSRNIDKANTVLFRYQEQQAEANGYIDYSSTQRPRSVQRVATLKDAEAWRKQVLTEINQKVVKIQDPVLSNYQIRDLNDEINKLMRERIAWEYRIKELGGADYKSNAGTIAGGVVIRGYRYYGRAKELPGVKELLQKQADDKVKEQQQKDEVKTRQQKLKELQQRVELDYYGYYDEASRVSSDVRKKIIAEAKEILGDLMDDVDEQSIKMSDELLRFERKATKERTKTLRKQCAEPEFLLDDQEPPTMQDVESFLVEKRRKMIEETLNV